MSCYQKWAIARIVDCFDIYIKSRCLKTQSGELNEVKVVVVVVEIWVARLGGGLSN